MGFTSYRKWLNEIDANVSRGDISKEEHDAWEDLASEGITVLIPGGFKPIHAGNLDLIRRYTENDLVKEVRILVGPGIRGGIDQEKAAEIIERLTRDMPKVTVEEVKWPSPVLTAYKIIGDAQPGYYALASSSKGGDYERVENFVNKHRKGHKFSRDHEGVYVIEMPVSIDPILFKGRDDEHEGEPISASVLRNDIVNDDLDNFVTGYPNSDPEDIQYIWDELAETVMNESQFTSGTPTVSSGQNYDRYQSGYHYRDIHNIVPLTEDDDEPEDISEGGGAGHLMSPWEAMDMSFGEIKEFIRDAFAGRLENVTEKLDGQNIMATVKDGNVYLARTQKQMRNGGELAIRWDNVFDGMSEKTPENVKKAYSDAMQDLQTVFKTSELNWDELFKDGHRWLNMELLNPETENIVPYKEFQLRIHNIREIDDIGKEIDVIWEGDLMDKVIQEIDFAQTSGDLDKVHLIKKTNRVNFEKIDNVDDMQGQIMKKLDTLMEENHLDEDNNIGDYIAAEIKSWIEEHFKYNSFGSDPELIKDLIQRWAYGNKSKNIKAILKDKPDSVVRWVRAWDNKIDDRIGLLLDPLIEIFTRVGIAVLQSLSGIAASNPTAVSQGIKKKSEDAINKIKDFMARTEVEDPEDFEKKINYLETQLRRLEQSGGLEGVAPTEGIVFEYKGRLFKLTGNYLPILKMINFFQFGKDK